MDRRTAAVVTVATLVAALLVLGFAFGWFGGDAEAPPSAVTTPAPSPGAGGTPR